MYFIQFSMLQMKERAKFMPENKVFGQAVGGRKQKTTACSEDVLSKKLFSLFNKQ